MNELSISIVTPSFNQANYLEATIRSVLSQNYPNLQYVIIDGDSQDGSKGIIKKYQDKLHFSCSEKDSGHAAAINKGFAETDGQIMGWLNSDDMYAPGSLTAISQIFQAFPSISWISGYSSVWNKYGSLVSVESSHKNIYDFMLGNYGWIQQESTFWRRSLWNKVGSQLNQNYHLAVDGELWTRFFKYEKLVSVNCVLGGYRLHDSNRAFSNSNKIFDETERAINIMKGTLDSKRLNLFMKLKDFKNELRFKSLDPTNFFNASELEEISYRKIQFDLVESNWKGGYLPFNF